MFEDDDSGCLGKKMAGYHQFHAVRVAVAETLRATKEALVPLQVRESLTLYRADIWPASKDAIHCAPIFPLLPPPLDSL